MSVASAAVNVANVSTGWRWLAVLIGLGVIALLYLFVSLSSDSWNAWKLVEGADGRASTSKFQWLVWIIVILFAYTVLWVLRAKQGDYSAISAIPANVVTVLGFSTGTAAVAKGITSAYTQANRVVKPPSGGPPAPTNGADVSAAPSGSSTQPGLLVDDTGAPELAKIQMIGFTFVAVGIFLATLVHQVVHHPVTTGLPNIDSTLLVLMGISQGGYLGKKLVTYGSPVLFLPSPSTALVGATVTLSGSSFGTTASNSQLLMDGTPIAFASWSDTAIVFTVPSTDPALGAAWTGPRTVDLTVVVGGQTSNVVKLRVVNAS